MSGQPLDNDEPALPKFGNQAAYSKLPAELTWNDSLLTSSAALMSMSAPGGGGPPPLPPLPGLPL
jgi:hypothetical protein